MESLGSVIHDTPVNFNLTFGGFSAEEIYGESKWRIEPMTKSTTISVNPIYFDSLISQLTHLYGHPVNKGKRHGLIHLQM